MIRTRLSLALTCLLLFASEACLQRLPFDQACIDSLPVDFYIWPPPHPVKVLGVERTSAAAKWLPTLVLRARNVGDKPIVHFQAYIFDPESTVAVGCLVGMVTVGEFEWGTRRDSQDHVVVAEGAPQWLPGEEITIPISDVNNSPKAPCRDWKIEIADIAVVGGDDMYGD